MIRGVVGGPRRAVVPGGSSAMFAAEFAARSLLVMWGVGGFSSAAEISHEVDCGDDGASIFLNNG
jgi:hypothetical protein